MHDQRKPQESPDATREWLLQLERRVETLERESERQLRNRRRSRLVLLCGVALYVLVLYWEMRSIL